MRWLVCIVVACLDIEAGFTLAVLCGIYTVLENL